MVNINSLNSPLWPYLQLSVLDKTPNDVSALPITNVFLKSVSLTFSAISNWLVAVIGKRDFSASILGLGRRGVRARPVR